MKVLITGGAGFIGSHVADRLLESGHSVLILDNYQTGKKENNASHPGLAIVEGSVADARLVKKLFAEFMPDAVLHAAASYKDPDNWQEDIATNVNGTINITRTCAEHSVKKLIYLQTSLCYGIGSSEKSIKVGTPYFNGGYHGGSSYAISKTGGELYLELSGQKFISFRLANVYGPRNLSGPLPTFYKRLSHGQPCTVVNTRRDFVYISDIVDAIEKALNENTVHNGYFHLSSGADHSIRELFEKACKYMLIDKPHVEETEMRSDDVRTILLDPSETKKIFNWSCKIGLDEGVKRTIEWYKLSTLSETYTHLKNFY